MQRCTFPTAALLFLISLGGWLSPASAAAVTEGKPEAAARASAIAPFLDETVFLVGRADLSRLPVGPIAQKIARFLPQLNPDPEAKAEILQAAPETEKVRLAFLGTGAKEVYVVGYIAGTFVRYPPFAIVIPVGEKVDEQALCALFDRLKPGKGIVLGRAHRCLVIGDPAVVERFVKLRAVARPELSQAMAAASDTALQVLVLPPPHTARALEQMMPELPPQAGGGPITVVTRGVLWAAASLDVTPEISLRLVIQSRDAAAAVALRDKWTEIVKLAGKQEKVRAQVKDFDRVAAALAPRVERDRVVFSLEPTQIQGLLGMVSPALEHARTATRGSQSTNNLKMLALAMHNYHDVYKRFPPHAVYSADGKPLLSWRVLLLPFVEQNSLHKKFRMNEPWDSEHNKALIAQMPPVYRSPASKLRQPGKTSYLLPIGPGTAFGKREGPRIADITDGASNTILIAEAADEQAVIWTKPDDLPYDPKDPGKGLWGMYGEEGTNAVLCDGSVRFLARKIDPETLRRLIECADGKPLGNF